MIDPGEIAGLAALSICEALLLAMKERGVLPEEEFSGILQDAAAAHENATGSEAEMAEHRAVAELIGSIVMGDYLGQRMQRGRARLTTRPRGRRPKPDRSAER